MSTLQHRLQEIQTRMGFLRQQLQNSTDQSLFDKVKANAPLALEINSNTATGTVQMFYENGTINTILHIEDTAPENLTYTIQNLEFLADQGVIVGTVTTADGKIIMEKMQLSQNILSVLNYRKYNTSVLISCAFKHKV